MSTNVKSWSGWDLAKPTPVSLKTRRQEIWAQLRARLNEPSRVWKVKGLGEMTKNWPVGTPVVLTTKHKWAGVAGEVSGYEKLPGLPELGECMKVKMEHGRECFVTKDDEVRLARIHRPHATSDTQKENNL